MEPSAFGWERPDPATSEEFGLGIECLNFTGCEVQVPSVGVTVIVGPNNAGKSTLLNAISFRISNAADPRPDIHSWLTSVVLEKRGSHRALCEWLYQNYRSRWHDGRVQSFMTEPAVPTQTSLTPLAAKAAWDGFDHHLGELAPYLVKNVNALQRASQSYEAPPRSRRSGQSLGVVHQFQDNPKKLSEAQEALFEAFSMNLTLDLSGQPNDIRIGHTDAAEPTISQAFSAFDRAVEAMPTFPVQGHGIQAFASLLFPLIAYDRPITLIDEPEIFLHPPQARLVGKLLGRMSGTRRCQMFVATHSEDIVTGLLQTDTPTAVIRLTRGDGAPKVHSVTNAKLKLSLSDLTFRHSRVFSGLFADLVVLAEAPRDCALLEAALDSYQREDNQNPRIDVQFIATYGIGRMKYFAQLLQDLGVPYVISPDLDIWGNASEVLDLCRIRLGQTPGGLAAALTQVRNAVKQRPPLKVGTASSAITSVLGDDPLKTVSSSQVSRISKMLEDAGDWNPVKREGVAFFRSENFDVARRLLNDLDELGIVCLQEGELESLYPQVQKKDAEWLPKALEGGAHLSDPARRHVGRLLKAYRLQARLPA